MSDGPYYYRWQNEMVRVWPYESDNGEIDVTALVTPEHPTGYVPEGETHYLIESVRDQNVSWWASERALSNIAEPVDPEALKREGWELE